MLVNLPARHPYPASYPDRPLPAASKHTRQVWRLRTLAIGTIVCLWQTIGVVRQLSFSHNSDPLLESITTVHRGEPLRP